MRYKYSYDQVVEMFKEDKDTPPFIFYYNHEMLKAIHKPVHEQLSMYV